VPPEVLKQLTELKAKAEKGDAQAQFELGTNFWRTDPNEAIKWFQKAAEQNHKAAFLYAGSYFSWTASPTNNPQKGFDYFLRGARLGDADCQYFLGQCYIFGDGTETNTVEGLRWAVKSAEQGYWLAQWSLGEWYYKGVVVPKNLTNAIHFYQLLAERRDEFGGIPVNEDSVSRAQFQLGYIHATETKNPVEAVKWYRKAAEQGNARAQANLGLCYHQGIGVAKDPDEAVKWIRKAAEQGDARAEGGLGVCYAEGVGVTKDPAEAVKWYRKAAEQGNAVAQYNLGVCYQNGEGVAKDTAEAVKWYRKAAEQGDALAQVTLGYCYATGIGVLKDSTEAAKWYRISAEQGDATAQYNLALCYQIGTGVTNDFSESAKWFRKAAEQGHPDAQTELGKCYAAGHGVPQDYAESVRWIHKAADQNNARAQSGLGVCYEVGMGVTEDIGEAVKWYRRAAEQGNTTAQYNLGICYYNGKGVLKDANEAVRWIRKAAEQGYADAQSFLGACYVNGWGVSKDLTEAVKWRRKAAEQGVGAAQRALGAAYALGQGVPQNDVEAYMWLSLAAAQLGDQEGLRDHVAKRMSRAEIVEGQRRSSAFVASKEAEPTAEQRDPLDIDKPSIPAFDPNQPYVILPQSTGTAFFIADDGYLLTCAHVVSPLEPKTATGFLDGRAVARIEVTVAGKTHTAKLVKMDKANDVAVLKISGDFKSIPLAASRAVKLGDAICTLGFPNTDIQGTETKFTAGEINSLAGVQDDPRYFQISVPVQPGNSGGPLLDSSGNVIGLVSARLADIATLKITGSLPQNVNYALKSSFITAFLETLPEVSAKLKSARPNKSRPLAEIADEAKPSVALVTVY
jgi:TPR repeat protein